MTDPTIDQMIACVKREVSMRERVYPRWIEAGRMTPEKADAELNTMRAVLKKLERERDAAQGSLL